MLNGLRLSHKRVQLSSIVVVVLALTLLGVYLLKASNTSSVEAAAITHLTPHQVEATMAHLAPHQTDGPVIVRLFQVPGFIYPSFSGVPEWTLYGDGLLVFKNSNSLDLVQAHLTPANFRSILNVIVQQNSFFASTKDAYGRPIPDMGSVLLSVNANGQQKQVRLYGAPTTPEDVQTQHVFAIENFLLNYRPATTQPYIAPGVALIAIAQSGDSTGLLTWPYRDLSLAQTAAQECPLVSAGANTCPSVHGSKTGVATIWGSRGLALLHLIHDGFYARVKEQGKIYRLIIWPLLPDAFYPRPNGSPAIDVQGASKSTWPLILSGSNTR